MHILVCDDEESQRELLAGFLRNLGHTVTTARNGKEAIEKNRKTGFDLAIIDLKMPEIDGIETMKEMKSIDPQTYFIILTGFGTIESAVQAMKYGAYDYLSKPVDLEKIEMLIKRIHEEQITHQEISDLKEQIGERFKFDEFVAESPKMKEILSLIPRIARSDAPVLILGESGTGKELIARLVHEASPRRGQRFVPISCAALPETLIESELFGYERGAFSGAEKRKFGKFELADKGTLFLDEIGDLPISVQVKLLRVLQEFTFERLGGNIPIKVDVRLICATNQDLKKKIKEGTFREDLYYRLNVITITLPPLRERKEDIKPLVEHFIKKFGRMARKQVKGITKEALNNLIRYDWPGNVRELENVIERALVLCRGDWIGVEDVPLQTSEIRAIQFESLTEVEKNHIMEILKKTNWNITESARRLGIHRNTLRLKIKEYNLKPE
jgi:DNA-binding NtrC family response regulator|uniref:Sigma-54-dependent Fis family transcriptional regulator n=1 Tax=candidate division WOR-3 bacterium TaxID=2052148 RepID=A0A7V3RIG1_UNCW3